MAADAGALNWTNEQRRGIETTGRSLLVSAAAGSGKTAVLAERCAYLVCDAPPEHRCDVDELLVVTFTKAAAAEMRNRIERALRQRLVKHDDARLARQLMLLDRANISTLHSFCSGVLRRHFNVAGLDPNFRTLDEDEAFLLRIETARQLLADRYETDAAGQFQQFIDAYADGDDERVLQRMIHAHNLLCSVVDPRKWIDQARASIAEGAGQPLDKSQLGREMARLVSARLGDFRRRCIDLAGQLAAAATLVRYVEYVNDLIAAVDEVRARFDGRHFDRLAEAMGKLELPDIPRMSGTTPGKDQARKQIDKLRAELASDGELYKLCRFTATEWRDGLKGILPAVDVFTDLVREFTQRYTAAKAEVGALDFNDLERLTLGVLHASGDDGRLAPTSTARLYHRQFKHVLVDEYQDINEVQDAILSLVSRECVCGEEGAVQNLFCVGDVKQSIYRFRLADPQRFLRRSERLRTCHDPAIGEVIDLQSNFRSRGPLLEALNAIFERLMTAAAAEIDYDQSHRLRPGAKYPPSGGRRCFAGAPIEMHLLPPSDTEAGDNGSSATTEAEIELDRTEREAAFVAHRIRALVEGDGSGKAFHVLDKSADGEPILRPIRYKDIVVLLRATQYKAAQFAEMLRANRVPVHTEASSGFFESSEISDMLALLTLLDNRQQDIPLAAVLRSPLSGLAEADDGLARIRLAYCGFAEPVPFHHAVVRYAREQDDELAAHLRDLLARLDRWRMLAHQRPLAEVLWEIYDDTGYLAFCAGLEDGEQRVANLVRLHERARQFGTFQRQGLRRFIQFLQSLQDDEHDLGQPSVASEADDVVKVMSIHRAKGLEFPVVVVADLGKKHNLQDLAGPILIDREAGLGLVCVDEAKGIRYPSLASVLVQERIRRQVLAEEMRVLYVAMTRAREHLILVGTCKPEQPERWAQRWTGHTGALPSDELLRGAGMLDWLCPAAAAASALSPQPIDVRTHDEREVLAWSEQAARRPQPSDRQHRLARLEPLRPEPPSNSEAERVRRRLTDPYPHAALTTLPATQTVASLTKHSRPVPAGDGGRRRVGGRSGDGLPAPRCVTESLAPSALEVGSIIHVVLQHLDFSRPCTRADVKDQIHDMIGRKFIAAAAAEVVDLDAIDWLVSTELGALLRARAAQLRRELPVFFPMPATDASDPLDRVMIRGRIDAMVPDEDGLVLLDYKSDRVTGAAVDERVEIYRPQVQSYAGAIEGIIGARVKAVHLVFLAAREIRTLPISR